MQVMPGSPSLEKIAQRWHDLAEQRLAYYTEMYRSGRWKHYYTQESFAVRMLDVIEAAKKWRELAERQQTLPQPVLQQAVLAQAYAHQTYSDDLAAEPQARPLRPAARVRSAA